MIKRHIRHMLMCLLVVFSSGCGAAYMEPPAIQPSVQQTPAPVSQAVEEGTPSPNGRLTVSMRAPKTFNPLLNEDVTVDRMLKLLFEPLMALNEEQKPVPRLAREVLFAPDGLNVVITLRSGLIWSDGEPITSKDVAYSLQTIKDAGPLTIYSDTCANVASWDTPDEQTIIISYYEPYGGSSYFLCFPVIPEHYYGAAPIDSTDLTPIGSGIYSLDEYSATGGAKLRPNPHYAWEKPLINYIDVIITPDVQTDMYAFSEGVADCLNSDVSEWGKYRGGKEADVADYACDSYDFIGFNFNSVILRERLVRQAIAHAVDVDYLIESIYLNHAVRAYTAISPASWVFEPNTAAYGFDQERAAELLAQAGYREVNGVLERNVTGVRQPLSLTILVNSENDGRVKIARALRDSLEKLHITATVDVRPFDEYEGLIENRTYDIFVGGMTMGTIPDISFAFHSSAATEGGLNVFSYKNTVMDSLITEANNAVTDNAYKDALSELQKYFAEDIPCVSLVFRQTALITDKRIKGDIRPVYGNPYANINEWYVYGDE